MGLQKYRADKAGSKQSDGAVPYYTDWVGGPSLALIRNCRIEGIDRIAYGDLAPRTVYIQGEPDTYFSIPAACEARIDGKRKVIKGFVMCEGNEMYFRAYKNQS